MEEILTVPKNICPNCGGDIEALKEMFPDGWTTCEELELTEEEDDGDSD